MVSENYWMISFQKLMLRFICEIQMTMYSNEEKLQIKVLYLIKPTI